MNSSKTTSFLLSYTFHFVTILFVYQGTIHSADRSVFYSLNVFTPISTKIYNDTLSDKKAPVNFYKTDSIFSFRSQKGYFPSLIHNIGEQAAAPFHFTPKQRNYTGVAAGITTA